jgi:3-oxoacyl-[acyl-carrier protein] reductase
VIIQQSNTQDLPRLSTVVKVDPYTRSDPSVKRPYFAEKRVIVTGASSGIGRAVAMWFLNSGARVALIGTDLEDLINTGKQFPKQALVIKCDLSADDQPYDMFNTVMHEFNGVDILVNAAGILREGDIKTMKPQEYDRIIDVNLRSVFYLSYLFFPALQKSRGCIVNVSCQYGAKPFAGMYAYCMSKAGLETLTKHMAYEFASSGVRVNAVAPGLVETNLLRCRVGEPKLDESDINQIYSNAEKFNPLKRIASIDDVGKAIVFLCSDAASHTTGQILKVDGGRTLTSSGWFLWEGHKAASSIIEPKESVISTFKGKILAPSNIMLGYTEKDRIEALSKRTNWSTTDKEAHANIKGAIYHEQDARHEYNAQIVGRAMENQGNRIFP